jgi:hypothetical protein
MNGKLQFPPPATENSKPPLAFNGGLTEGRYCAAIAK